MCLDLWSESSPPCRVPCASLHAICADCVRKKAEEGCSSSRAAVVSDCVPVAGGGVSAVCKTDVWSVWVRTSWRVQGGRMQVAALCAVRCPHPACGDVKVAYTHVLPGWWTRPSQVRSVPLFNAGAALVAVGALPGNQPWASQVCLCPCTHM